MKKHIWSIKKFFLAPSPLGVVLGISLFLGIFFVWYVSKLDLVTRLVDQNSHLNLSRLVWDSLTPGISQIGFWPPLVHILMAPFTVSDFFFRKGISGAMVSIPSLLLATYFLHRLIFRFTRSQWISAMGTLSFSLSPYILYYSSTPMMEVLFICNLFGATYFLLRWLESEKVRYLVATSVFVALASISRFEGLILVPLVGLILISDLIRKKRSYSEMEATTIVYSLFSGMGILFILSYGWAFGDNPFAFANSDWSAFAQQRDFFLPTENNSAVSFLYLLHASYHMLGQWQIWVGIGSAALLMISFFSLEVFAVLCLLLSPFLFDWLALFRGNIILYVSELPPYDTFFNERYGLYWVGLIVFAPAAFLGMIKAKYYSDKGSNLVFGLIAGFILTSLIFLNVGFLYKTAITDKFKIISESAQGYPSEDQKVIAYALSEQYDGGKILITRALHDFVTVNAGIPLKNYIHESNYLFYDQALEKPWIFARWVVMYNISQESSQLDWSKKNEKISARWGGSDEFLQNYELVISNERESLYKVKELPVKESVARLGLDPSKVPSLNVDIHYWHPESIYEQMKLDQRP